MQTRRESNTTSPERRRRRLGRGAALLVLGTSLAAAAPPTAAAADAPPYLFGAVSLYESSSVVGARLAARYVEGIPGTQPITLELAWMRCDLAGDECTQIEASRLDALGTWPYEWPTYTVNLADVGHTVRARLTATGPGGSAFKQSRASRAAFAIAPTTTAVPTVTGTPRDGDTLQGDFTGSWSGTGPITSESGWDRCDATGANCASIAAADGSSYAARPEDVGHTLRYRVVATGPAGDTTIVRSEPTLTVRAIPPTAAGGEASVEGDARDGATLRGSFRGTWPGTGPITTRSRWERCDSTGAECSTISGASSPEYTAAAQDVGHTVRYRVIGTGRAGHEAAVVSEPSAVIAARPPVNLAVPKVAPAAADAAPGASAPASIQVGAALRVVDDAWDGTRDLLLTVQWERCTATADGCTAIGGAADRAYTPTLADVGRAIRARITATNLAGTAEAVTDPILVIDVDRVHGDLAQQPNHQHPGGVPGAAIEPLRAPMLLGLSQPRIRCVGELREHLAGTGTLSVRGALPGNATVMAGHRPVLRLGGGKGNLTIRTGAGKLLAIARDTGTVRFLRRSTGRVSASSESGRVLVAIGHQHTHLVVKGRVCTIRAAEGSTIVARADRPARATAFLTTDTGHPVPGATVTVKDGDRISEVRTDASGRARLELSAGGGSRTILLSYTGSKTNTPADKTVDLAVKGITSLTGTGNARTLRLQGTVKGPREVRVRVFYLDGQHRWRLLGRARAASDGRWSLRRLTPARHAGTGQLALRAITSGGGPFEQRLGGIVHINLVKR